MRKYTGKYKLCSMLKIEAERALRSRMLWAVLATGILITGTEFVMSPLKYSKDIIGGFDGSVNNVINTVFNSWFFSLDRNAVVLRQLYVMVMPLMAVFAYSGSAVSDIKSGYIKNIYTRTKKRNYLIAKCLVSHMAGGVAVVLPLLMNLAACSMILPSVKMEAAAGCYEPRGFSMLSGVAYTHPYVYIFTELFIIFMYTGLFTTCSVMLAQIIPVQFVALIAPFLINYFCYVIQNFLGLAKYSPMRIMMVGYSYSNTVWSVFAEYILLWLVMYGIYMYRGKRNEVL